MKGFPVFTSPLVIRPKAKQLIYLLLIGIAYILLQGYTAFHAAVSFDWITLIASVLMIFCAAYHIIAIRRGAEKDVTVIIPPVIVISAAQILIKLMHFFTSLSDFGWKSLIILLAECTFWAAAVFCIAKAVCGRYKLIVPLILLLFGFFYAFIRYELRDIVNLVSQLCLLLMLWFPVDAVVFTSLYVPDKDD